MNLPSNMLPKLGQENWKYRSEMGADGPHYSDEDQISYEQVSGSSDNILWPTQEFGEDTHPLKNQGWVFLATSLYLVWYFLNRTNSVNLGSVIFFMVVLVVPSAIFASAELLRVYFPKLRGKVILSDDHLICDRGLRRRPVKLSYRQICRVGLRPKSHLVLVEYYSIDQLENLQTNKLHNMVLPRTFNEEELQKEIRRRAFGPLPATKARAFLSIHDTGVAIGILIVLPLALAFLIGRLLH